MVLPKSKKRIPGPAGYHSRNEGYAFRHYCKGSHDTIYRGLTQPSRSAGFQGGLIPKAWVLYSTGWRRCRKCEIFIKTTDQRCKCCKGGLADHPQGDKGNWERYREWKKSQASPTQEPQCKHEQTANDTLRSERICLLCGTRISAPELAYQYLTGGNLTGLS